jgi:hypothetical protein
MKAKFITEKFSDEDTDPIYDMGIGEAEYYKLQQTYKQLNEYMEFDLEDLEFGKVIETLDYLRRISAYNVASYFNRKYSFNVRIDPKNIMGGDFAKGSFGKYGIVFSTSGPGKMIYVHITDKSGIDAIPIGTFMRNPGTNWAYQDTRKAEGSSRTLHGLHNKFKYFCKILNIDLTPYEI